MCFVNDVIMDPSILSAINVSWSFDFEKGVGGYFVGTQVTYL